MLQPVEYKYTKEEGNWFVFIDKMKFPVDNESYDFDDNVKKNELKIKNGELKPINKKKFEKIVDYDGIRLCVEVGNKMDYNIIIDYLWNDIIQANNYINQGLDSIEELGLPVNIDIVRNFDLINNEEKIKVKMFKND